MLDFAIQNFQIGAYIMCFSWLMLTYFVGLGSITSFMYCIVLGGLCACLFFLPLLDENFHVNIYEKVLD